MIIGNIDINPEEKNKKQEITKDIGFNPNRRNIVKCKNFNINTIKDKANDDVDKLTYHYLKLPENPNEENKDQNVNIISKDTNNIFTNFLYPTISQENTFFKNNNISYNSGTFLTDKINVSNQVMKTNTNYTNSSKINENELPIEYNINNINQKREEIHSTGYESIPEVKHSVPVNFDKLIVDITEEAGKPKPINPLFFIINGEKTQDKSKLINFRTNPSLLTTINCKTTKINFGQKKNKDLLIPKLSSMFNKACKDKSKLNFDLKRTIFNDSNVSLKDKYRLIKDYERNEMMNRALGRGIFSCNKNYDDEKRALIVQNRKKFEKFIHFNKAKLFINLRTNVDFFDERKNFWNNGRNIISDNIFKRDEDKGTKSNFDNDYNSLERMKSVGFIQSNKNLENLLHPQKREKNIKTITRDTKMDKILKNANFEYQKPYDYLASFIKTS